MKNFVSLLLIFTLIFPTIIFGQEFTKTQQALMPDNYLKNPGFEDGVIGYSAYADSGSTPTDGTGGSPTVTVASSTSTPIKGARSLVFTKPASNVQGQGFSTPFTIDPSDKGKVLRVDLDYQIASGTYVDDDVQFWIYDVTNSALIPLTPYKLKNSTIIDTLSMEFQSSSSSTSYRLIGHVAVSTTSAFTLKLDRMSLARQAKVYGSSVSDYVNKGTITIGATTTAPTKGTVVTDRILTGRVGQRINALYQYQQSAGGAAGSGNYLFSLPSGLSFDSSLITFDTGSDVAPNTALVGYGQIKDNSNNTVTCVARAYDATRFRIHCGFATGANFMGSTVVPLSAAASFNVFIDAPISGWGSTQQSSSEADTRVVNWIGYFGGANTAMTLNVTPIPYTTIKDTHGGWNGTGYVVPVPGDYQINFAIGLTATSGAFQVYVDGVSTATVGYSGGDDVPQGRTVLENLKAGQVLQFRAGSSGKTITASTMLRTSITRISGPSQIMASESVSASYWVSANFAASSTTPINFDSKEWDTHSAVSVSPTAWKFTAPIAGTYQILGAGGFSTASNVMVYKNGSALKSIGYGTASSNGFFNGKIKLLAGEYIDIRPVSATVTFQGGTLNNSSISTNVSIERTGNY